MWCLLHRNLGNNIFPTLPIRGLAGLLHLKTFNNPALREFPSPERFPRVQTMLLSYAYHCCSFLSIEVEESVTRSPVRESILFPTDDFDSSLWNSTFSDIWPQLGKSIVSLFFINFSSYFLRILHPSFSIHVSCLLLTLNCCKASSQSLRIRSFKKRFCTLIHSLDSMKSK